MEEKIVKEIPVDKIIPNPYQPRRVFSEKSLEELKNSIESYGVKQIYKRIWSSSTNHC